MVASPGRDGGELPGHQFKAGQILQRAQGPRLTQLVGLTRARGRWWIRRRRISISRLSDRDGPDPRRGEVRGRSQSHPGSIDGGVEPRLTQLVGLTRARGRWWIRRRRISISRLSDRDGPDPRRGEVRGRSQSHPGSIDGGVEPRLTQLVGLTRARGRWWIRRRRISISRLSDRDGPDPRRGEVRGRSQSHPGSIDGGVEPRLTQLVGLTRARGRWWIRRRRISISRLSDRDGPDPRRGEVRGRSQSHPGSIDGGVEPRLTQLVGLTRARGRWWIWRRRISISRLSDRDGPDPRRGEVRGRSQSHPGSIDGGVEPRLTQLVGLTRARGRWWNSAAADFYFAIIRSRRAGPAAW